METWEWVVIGVVLAGAAIFTLAWWWLADTWADSEHKRFKRRDTGSVEKVVIKGMGSTTGAGAAADAGRAPGVGGGAGQSGGARGG